MLLFSLLAELIIIDREIRASLETRKVDYVVQDSGGISALLNRDFVLFRHLRLY